MKSPFLILLIQIIIIPIIILIFKIPAEKPLLSIFANAIFMIVGLITLLYRGKGKILILISGLQFLFTAVIPISILRILSWGKDFNNTSLLGLTGAQWHSYSNYSYLFLLLGTSICCFKFIRKSNSKN